MTNQCHCGSTKSLQLTSIGILCEKCADKVRQRCTAKTHYNQRCRNSSFDGSGLCNQHKTSSEKIWEVCRRCGYHKEVGLDCEMCRKRNTYNLW